MSGTPPPPNSLRQYLAGLALGVFAGYLILTGVGYVKMGLGAALMILALLLMMPAPFAWVLGIFDSLVRHILADIKAYRTNSTPAGDERREGDRRVSRPSIGGVTIVEPMEPIPNPRKRQG